MKVLVSACLLGENCKYNGGNNKHERLLELLWDKEVISVCPEILGGLPTPRIPVELVNNVPMTRDGHDTSLQIELGIQKSLNLCRKHEIDLAVLQSRSPTCGRGKIYDGSFSGKLTEGNGRLVQVLMEEGITVFDVEEYVKQNTLE